MGEESPRILCSVVDWDRDGIDEVALLGSRILAVRSARGPSANTESLPEWRDLSVLDDTVVAIQILDVDGDGKKHKPFHKTEVLVPVVFGLVHGFQFLAQVPWQWIGSVFWPST